MICFFFFVLFNSHSIIQLDQIHWGPHTQSGRTILSFKTMFSKLQFLHMEKLASNHASPCRIVSVHCNRLTVHHQPSNVWYWNDIEKQTQVHSPEGIKAKDQCETTWSVREYVWQSHWIFARSKQPMWRKGKSQQTLTQSLSWIFVFGLGGGDGS